MDVFDLSATLRLDTSQYDNALSRAEGSAKSFGKGLGGASSGVAKLSQGFTILKGTAAHLAAEGIGQLAGAIRNNLGGAISRVDIMNNYSIVMQNLGHSSKDAEIAINELSDGIDGLPTTLDSIASVQQQFAALGGPLKDATELTLALNNATLAGGQGQEKANGAMQQWYQMIAAGKSDLMSMRIINEAMPAQMDAIAKSVIGPKANWQALHEEWQKNPKITGEVKEAILELNKEGSGSMASFEEQAIAATGGIGTSLTNLKTKITKTLADIVQAIGAKDIANAFSRMKDGIDVVGKSITNLIEAYKGGGIGGVIHELTLQGNAVDESLTSLASKIEEHGPEFVQKAIYLAEAFGEALMKRVPYLIAVGGELVIAISKGIIKTLPNLMKRAATLMFEFAEKLMENKELILEKIRALGKTIGENLPSIIQGIFKMAAGLIVLNGEIISTAIQGALGLISGIISGIWEAVKKVTIRKWAEIKQKIKEKIEEIKKAVREKISLTNFTEGISGKIEAIKRKIDEFKKKFPVNLGKLFTYTLPKGFKLMIKDGPALAKKLGFTGKMPKFVWGAQGGIMNVPTIVGGGEAGREALLPLDPFWKKMDNIANATSGQQVNITNYITVDGADNPEDFADRLVRQMRLDMRAT